MKYGIDWSAKYHPRYAFFPDRAPTFSANNAVLDMNDQAWLKSVNSNTLVMASRPGTYEVGGVEWMEWLGGF
jgi:hypothetical protein